MKRIAVMFAAALVCLSLSGIVLAEEAAPVEKKDTKAVEGKAEKKMEKKKTKKCPEGKSKKKKKKEAAGC
jgi:hypothetical protein